MINRKPLGSHRSFHDLMIDYDLLIQPAKLAKWRLLFPNAGELDGFPHFGLVQICATDGLEAFYHIGTDDYLWKGHLKAFNGPVAKTYVWEEDWDYENRKRKVNVFRRGDGSLVIIPRDSFMDAYWEKHTKLPQWERDLYANCLTIDGMLLRRGQTRFEDLADALEQMRERYAKPESGPRQPSRRQQILASL